MTGAFRLRSRLAVALALLTAPLCARAATPTPSLDDFLSYPFQSELAAAPKGDAIAWVSNVRGDRNIWAAKGPAFIPRQITHYEGDDGQELTQLTFSPDGARLVWARGGDHDANWPAEGDLEPNPAASADKPEVTLWSLALAGGAPVAVGAGDAPAVSALGVLAFVRAKQVWSVPLAGKAKASRLFFDRGHAGALAWSPDGTRLAFVSDRGDHAFIGVFETKTRRLTWLAPSTSKDGSPRWSPDGVRIAFTRRRGDGGAPTPLLTEIPDPWSIWVADATSGEGRAVWRSPVTLAGSYPDVAGEANLHWAAGDRLVFLAELDDWQHLYAVSATGGEARLLTPGAFMVEDVSESRDGATMIYSANTGAGVDDGERRHLFQVAADGSTAPRPVTGGDTLAWRPAVADPGHVAYIAAGARTPPFIALAGLGATEDIHALNARPQSGGFPTGALVVPKAATFAAPDGMVVHGQIFESAQASGAAKPGIVFVHGGPPRQMMLGWHYMDYYSNAYAVNQYLATHGFVVLSVNYRLGIGYGRAFSHPEHAGPAGAAEYQDVLAGARFLQHRPGVDPGRIGIWGGSYGGYLTAMALARNSDVFKAGVDLHGVHDWSRILGHEVIDPAVRFEKGDRDEALRTAWTSSPDADVAGWRSPVLLIQGDDDRNVPFQQTIDLARRLEDRSVAFDELVLPNEIHGFLRHRSWVAADTATVRFFDARLGGGGN